MAEQKPCVKCGRSIDSLARTCVYCNWDQETTPPTAAEAAAAPVYIPPKDHRARNRILAIAAFAFLIVGAFFVGSMLHGGDPKDGPQTSTVTTTRATATPSPSHRSDVTLVPMEGGGEGGTQPVDYHVAMTSVPIAATATGDKGNAQSADATALPSQQYAAAAARVQTQPSKPVDPRTVRGEVLQSGQRAGNDGVRPHHSVRRDPSMAVAQAATSPHSEPVPVYQPVPHIRVDRDSTARLYLTVGDDGRVRDIEVVQSVPGEMPKLIGAVQNWRFRPAMQDGQPVSASFTVNITFHANE